MPLKCAWCSEQVIPTKEINWFIFITLLLLGVVGVLIYMMYWAGKPWTLCPLCAGDVYGRYKTTMSSGVNQVVLNGRYYRMDQTIPYEAIQSEIAARVAQSRQLRKP